MTRSTSSTERARRAPKPAPQLAPYKFTKGKSGNPKGKPKGLLDKVHRLQLQAAATGASPLDILLAIARKDEKALATMDIDPKHCTLVTRKSAAEACLPYICRRMPQALDIEVSNMQTMQHFQTWLSLMSDRELEVLVPAIERINAVVETLPATSLKAAPRADLNQGEATQ